MEDEGANGCGSTAQTFVLKPTGTKPTVDWITIDGSKFILSPKKGNEGTFKVTFSYQNGLVAYDY